MKFFILLALQVVLWLFAISPTKIYGTDLNSHYFEHSGRSLAAGSGAWYINCGAPEDSKDERGINLESDNKYADSGNSSSISSSLSTNNAGTLWEELKSLRSFPKGQRNCYTLRLTKQQSNNISYLITALFLYGNYDGANSPPTFDLYVGNTFWTKVQIESADKVYFHDVVHTPKADSVMISVCLVNTSLGTPFVSALQVRPLKQDSVYWIDSGRQLTLLQRDDCGGNASTPQRFDGDEYDRIWENDKIFEKTIVRETNRNFSVGSSDQPPLGVLRTAIKPKNQSTDLNHEFGDSNSSYLVYLHFAETEEYHSRLHKRIFIVGFNNVTNGSYTLDSVNPKVVYRKNPIPGPINISITYECDRDRDLPILNAMEIFQVVPVSENVTHPDDVNAMLDIKRAYKIQIEDWQGDPCFPIGLDSCWSRLSCSKVSDKSPARIISLNLSSVGLAGNLTESISNLKLIERLDVSNNNLTGSVPESFEQLDLLKEVNLTGNKLEGHLPTTLCERSKNGSLNISYNENPNHCPDASQSNSKKIGIIVGSTMGSLTVTSAVIYTVMKSTTSMGLKKVTQQLLGTTNSGADIQLQQDTIPENTESKGEIKQDFGQTGEGTGKEDVQKESMDNQGERQASDQIEESKEKDVQEESADNKGERQGSDQIEESQEKDVAQEEKTTNDKEETQKSEAEKSQEKEEERRRFRGRTQKPNPRNRKGNEIQDPSRRNQRMAWLQRCCICINIARRCEKLLAGEGFGGSTRVDDSTTVAPPEAPGEAPGERTENKSNPENDEESSALDNSASDRTNAQSLRNNESRQQYNIPRDDTPSEDGIPRDPTLQQTKNETHNNVLSSSQDHLRCLNSTLPQRRQPKATRPPSSNTMSTTSVTDLDFQRFIESLLSEHTRMAAIICNKVDPDFVPQDLELPNSLRPAMSTNYKNDLVRSRQEQYYDTPNFRKDKVAPEDGDPPEGSVAPEDGDPLKDPSADVVALEDGDPPEGSVAPEDGDPLEDPSADVVAPEDGDLLEDPSEDVVAHEDGDPPEGSVAPEDGDPPEGSVAPEDGDPLEDPSADVVAPEDGDPLEDPSEDVVAPEDSDPPEDGNPLKDSVASDLAPQQKDKEVNKGLLSSSQEHSMRIAQQGLCKTGVATNLATQPRDTISSTSNAPTVTTMSSIIDQDFKHFLDILFYEHMRMTQIICRIDPNFVPKDLELPEVLRPTTVLPVTLLTNDENANQSDNPTNHDTPPMDVVPPDSEQTNEEIEENVLSSVQDHRKSIEHIYPPRGSRKTRVAVTQPRPTRLFASTASTTITTSSIIDPNFQRFIDILLSEHTRMIDIICNKVDSDIVPQDLELSDAVHPTVDPLMALQIDDNDVDSSDKPVDDLTHSRQKLGDTPFKDGMPLGALQQRDEEIMESVLIPEKDHLKHIKPKLLQGNTHKTGVIVHSAIQHKATKPTTSTMSTTVATSSGPMGMAQVLYNKVDLDFMPQDLKYSDALHLTIDPPMALPTDDNNNDNLKNELIHSKRELCDISPEDSVPLDSALQQAEKEIKKTFLRSSQDEMKHIGPILPHQGLLKTGVVAHSATQPRTTQLFTSNKTEVAAHSATQPRTTQLFTSNTLTTVTASSIIDSEIQHFMDKLFSEHRRMAQIICSNVDPNFVPQDLELPDALRPTTNSPVALPTYDDYFGCSDNPELGDTPGEDNSPDFALQQTNEEIKDIFLSSSRDQMKYVKPILPQRASRRTGYVTQSATQPRATRPTTPTTLTAATTSSVINPNFQHFIDRLLSEHMRMAQIIYSNVDSDFVPQDLELPNALYSTDVSVVALPTFEDDAHYSDNPNAQTNEEIGESVLSSGQDYMKHIRPALHQRGLRQIDVASRSTAQPSLSKLSTSTALATATSSYVINSNFQCFIDRLLSQHTTMAQIICNKVDSSFLPQNLELPDALRPTVDSSVALPIDEDNNDRNESTTKFGA